MKRPIALILCLLLLSAPALSQGEPAPAAPTASPSPTRAPGLLQPGDTGEDVSALQQHLIDLGFLSGEPDGRFGPRTQEAVKTLQTYLSEQGVSTRTDGVWEDALYAYLSDPDLFSDWFILRKGDEGPLVARLQQRLIDLGFLLGRADGAFGEATFAALYRFQETLFGQGVSEMTPDGVAGPITQRYLYDTDLSGYAIVTPATYDAADPLSLRSEHLYCTACVLMDADTGTVLFAKNPQDTLYPASTTKIMTLLLALDTCDLAALVTVPACADDVPKDSSRVPIHEGEQMTWRDLLHGLILKSGNDAANAAAYLTSGSVEAFVDLMNQKAALLGMKHTHFSNPHGYHDPQHYSTALDLARIASEGLSNPDFVDIVSCTQYTMSATSLRWQLKLETPYAILKPDADEYYEGAFGIKTGYTSAAGRCYVGGATRDGHTLLCAVFHSGTAASHKFIDAARLFDFGFASLASR